MNRLLVMSMSLLTFFASAQNISNHGSGRENWFPNRGNVGIGTRSPSKDLEVIGDMNTTGTIFSNRVESTSIKGNSIVILNDAIINGRLGIGVNNPTEKLDVLGNFRLQGNLLAQGINIQTLQSNSATFNSLTVNQDALFKGLVGIGVTTPSEKLHIGGNLKVDNSISSASFTTGQFSTTGLASFNDNVSFSKDITLAGTFNGTTIKVQQGNFSQGIDASAGNIAGALQVGGPFNSQSVIAADIKSTGILSGSSLTISGLSNLSAGATIGGNTKVNDLQVNGSFNAGNISLAEINTTGKATIGQNLTVNGESALVGNVTVTGNIKAGVIEATEFKTSSGGSPFNFDNAIISQTLSVANTKPVPANYKVAVGGTILATGVDLKTPSKWPDYVFEEQYIKISISDLEKFIKQNGHLPSIPSAKEMEAKQNYSLSEMDAKLLEKIEELTLYVIELKKEIESLKKK